MFSRSFYQCRSMLRGKPRPRPMQVERLESRLVFNTAPLGLTDNFAVLEDRPLTLPVPGVLFNDFDADGDSLSAELVTPPERGSLTLLADGSFSYLPRKDYFGPDAFTYVAFDGSGRSLPTTVNLNVVSVADNRLIGKSDFYLTHEDSTLNIGAAGLLVAAAGFNDNTGLYANGELGQPYELNSILAGRGNGEPGWDGPWQATGQAAQVVSQEAIEGDGRVEIPGSSQSSRKWFTSGKDDFAVQMRIRWAGQAAATVQLFDSSSGLFGFNPADVTAVQLEARSDGRIFVSDKGVPEDTKLQVSANTWHTLSVTVSPRTSTYRFFLDGNEYRSPDALDFIAKAPRIDALQISTPAGAGGVSVDDLQIFAGVAQPGVLANDENVDRLTITAEVVSPPSHGTLVLNPDGTFFYSPRANFFGTDSFTYRAKSSSLTSEPTTVTIGVGSVFDPANAVDDSYAMDEDAKLTVQLPNQRVLANDEAGDAGPISASLEKSTSQGTLTFSSDGSFEYQPNPNFFGDDTFTYRVVPTSGDADTATVTIRVRPLSDAYQAVDEEYTLDEDTTLRVGLLSVVKNISTGFDDLKGTKLPDLADDLDYTVTETRFETLIGRTAVVVPGSRPHGTYVSDSAGANSRWVGLARTTQSDLNAYPTSFTFVTHVDLTGYDPATAYIQNLRFAADDRMLAIKVNGTQVHNGAEGFTQFVNAGDRGLGLFKEGVNEITFVVDNTSPGGYSPMGFRVDGFVVAYPAVGAVKTGVLANDDNPDRLPSSAALVTLPENGELLFQSDGKFSYTPAKDFHGADSFTYKVTDGPNGTARVHLVVKPVNNDPVAVADEYRVATNQRLAAGQPALVKNLGTSLDPVTQTKIPSWESVENYTVVGGTYDGKHPVSIASAQLGGIYLNEQSSTGSRWMTILRGPRDVTQLPGNYTFETTVDLTGFDPRTALIRNFKYAVDDSLEQILVNGKNVLPWGSGAADTLLDLGDFGRGAFVAGLNKIQFVVKNAGTSLNPLVMRWEGQVVADPTPTAPRGVLANDSASRQLPLRATLVTAPIHGSLSLNLDGTFDYIPAADFVGTDSFQYQASDARGSSAITDVVIRIGISRLGDFNADDDVDSDDLLTLLANWTGPLDPGSGGRDASSGDLDADADVDSADLLAFIGNWTGTQAVRTARRIAVNVT